MAITVYSVSGAPRGWRVLIGLTLKQLPYQVQYLEASKGDLKSDWFMDINPRGTIPVMEAEGLVLRDSLAILAWLDTAYPERPLFGKTREQSSLIWSRVTDGCDYLRDAIQGLLQPILVQNIDLATQDPASLAAIEKAANTLHTECELLDDLLVGKPYLCGEHPSAAEAICFPEIRLIQRAIEREPGTMKSVGFSDFGFRYPGLDEWLRQVETLPEMSKTMPVHWH